MDTLTFDQVTEKLVQRAGKDTHAPAVADYPELQSALNQRLQEIWDYPTMGWDFLRVVQRVDLVKKLKVEGFGTASANQYYSLDAAQVDGKDAFTGLTDNSVTIRWSSVASLWEFSGFLYTSSDAVDSPEEATTWQKATGADPVGTVTLSTYKTIELTAGERTHAVYPTDPREDGGARRIDTWRMEGDNLRLPKSVSTPVYWQYSPAAPDWLNDDPVPGVYKIFINAALDLAYADVLRGIPEHSRGKADTAEANGYRQLHSLINKYVH
jgi:hypothetical protein